MKKPDLTNQKTKITTMKPFGKDSQKATPDTWDPGLVKTCHISDNEKNDRRNSGGTLRQKFNLIDI